MPTLLVTGGSRGIGRAIVELFSREGYNVAFTYRSSHAEARALSEATGALAILADSKNEDEVNRAVEKTVGYFGSIDCLINNSAVSAFSVFTDITLDKWREMMAENLDGAFLYCRAVIPDMLKRKRGRIINISSMWGLVGSSCEVHYSTSKAALIGMTKALAKELGPSGITVNAIAPGVIDTDMNKSLSESDLDLLKEETPLWRIGKAEEVAAAALFLASDGASFITGDVINVSGGYVI